MPKPASEKGAAGVSKKRPLREKLAIVEEWEKSGESKYVIAKKYGLQSSQITRWARNKAILVERASQHPNNLTLHIGRTVTKPEAEERLLAFYGQRRENDLPVTPNILIDQALKIDPEFHTGTKKTLSSWVYGFIDRNKLVVSRSKRNSFTEAATCRVPSKTHRSAKTPSTPHSSTVPEKTDTKQAQEHSLLQPAPVADPTTSSPGTEDHSVAACREVRLYKGALGGDLYFAALDLLSDSGMARTFMVMADEDRLGWLQWKLKVGT